MLDWSAIGIGFAVGWLMTCVLYRITGRGPSWRRRVGGLRYD